MVLTGETLEHPVDGRLALGTRDLIIPRLAPQKPQHRKKKRDTLAVVEVLFKVGKESKKKKKIGTAETRNKKAKKKKHPTLGLHFILLPNRRTKGWASMPAQNRKTKGWASFPT